jgi:diguanylate cyclase (GGDEF)-like protein
MSGEERKQSRAPVYPGVVDIFMKRLVEATAIAAEEQKRADLAELEIKEQRALAAAMKELATIDKLTGLNNRRGLEDKYHVLQLENQPGTSNPQRAQDARQPAESLNDPVADGISVIFLDADEFKTANDTYGHARGDELLGEVASIMKDHTRETDILARFGGDEFVIVLPYTSQTGAVKVAENLRQGIADRDNGITLSIGVASAPTFPDSLDSIFRDADTALYKAKELGRNQVVEHGSTPLTQGPVRT